MSSYCVHTWGSTERKLPDSGHFRCLLKPATRKGWACVLTTWRKCPPHPRAGCGATGQILAKLRTFLDFQKLRIQDVSLGTQKAIPCALPCALWPLDLGKSGEQALGSKVLVSLWVKLPHFSGSISQLRHDLCLPGRAMSLRGPFLASWGGPGLLGGGSVMVSEPCYVRAARPDSSGVHSFATCQPLPKTQS